MSTRTSFIVSSRKSNQAIGKAVCLAILSAGSVGGRALAAESTWTGHGTSNSLGALWSSSGNWAGGIPGFDRDARFGTGFASGTTINALGTRDIRSIVIDTPTSFTLANFGAINNLIRLYGGDIIRTNASAGTQTMSGTLVLNGDANWNINGVGAVDISGTLLGHDDEDYLLEKTGNGTLLFTGSAEMKKLMSVSSGTLEIANTGSVSVDGPDQFNVGVTAAGAQLVVRDGGFLRSTNTSFIRGGSAAQVYGGGLWQIDRRAGSSMAADMNVGDTSAGTLAIDTGGRLKVAGSINVGKNASGTFTIFNGAVATTTFASVGVAGGSNGWLRIAGGNAALNVTDTMFLGQDAGSAGSLNIDSAGAAYIGKSLVLANSAARVSVNHGTLSVGALSGQGGVIQLISSENAPSRLIIEGSSDATFSGGINGSGSLVKNGNTTQTLSGPTLWTGTTYINAGTLVLPNGLAASGGELYIDANGVVSAAGLVNRQLSGNGKVRATGTLSIGDATHGMGVNFGGSFDVGSQSVKLLSSSEAILTGPVSMNEGAKLESSKGVIVAGTLSVNGNANATIATKLTSYGVVNGPTASGKSLKLSGEVTGFGTFTGYVALLDQFNPGFVGPSVTQFANVSFGDDATFVADVLIAGVPFQDEVRATGAVALDGELQIRSGVTGGPIPPQGTSFTIVTAPSITGQFDNITGQRLDATTWLATLIDPTSVRLAVALPGDATLDGSVNIADFSLLATRFNSAGFDWTGGDFNGDGIVAIGDFAAMAGNFNRTVAATLPRGSAVPEPAAASLLVVAAALHSRRRRVGRRLTCDALHRAI